MSLSTVLSWGTEGSGRSRGEKILPTLLFHFSVWTSFFWAFWFFRKVFELSVEIGYNGTITEWVGFLVHRSPSIASVLWPVYSWEITDRVAYLVKISNEQLVSFD